MAEGGNIAKNTKNVTIECKCVLARTRASRRVNWFASDKLPVSDSSSALDGTPYTYYDDRRKVRVLVIPEFNDLYSGKYICSAQLDTPNHVNATINLALRKTVYIDTVSSLQNGSYSLPNCLHLATCTFMCKCEIWSPYMHLHSAMASCNMKVIRMLKM